LTCGCWTTSSWLVTQSSRWPNWASFEHWAFGPFFVFLSTARCARAQGRGERFMAGGAGITWAAARSRDRGSRSCFPCRCATTKSAGRTDAQAAPAAALWSRPARQIVPPVTRHARGRAAGRPDILETPKPWSDRSGSNAAPVAALGSAWCQAVRRAAAAQGNRSPARCCSAQRGSGSACAMQPTAIPPRRPRPG
jgi:hypothetical protein